jgi:hypothetical protein
MDIIMQRSSNDYYWSQDVTDHLTYQYRLVSKDSRHWLVSLALAEALERYTPYVFI